MKARRVKKLDPAAPLIENAARIIRVRLDELRSFVPAALDRERATEQHDMRIAAKRLRYVLEATEFCFGPPARAARRRARDIQDVLGELHDCDVMLPLVAGQVQALHDEDAEGIRRRAGRAVDLDPALSAAAPHRAEYRGLEVLGVHVDARRAVLFDRFVELWAELEGHEIWEQLEREVVARLAASRERRAATERARRASRELKRAEHQQREASERARLASEALVEARRARDDPPPATSS
jgi:CHAD domain